MTISNIIDCFKVTGIFPYDSDIFNDGNFFVNSTTDRQETHLVTSNYITTNLSLADTNHNNISIINFYKS